MTGSDSFGAGSARTITVEVPDSDRRLRDAYTAIFSRSFVRVLPYYVWAVCFYAFVVFVGLLSPKRLFTAGNLEILAVIVLLAFLSLVWVPAWRARLDKPNGLLANIPTVWRFTAARVACSIGEHSSFDADWRALYCAEKLPHGLMLFTHRVVAHWIPRSFFASERDFDQAAEWAAFGVPRYMQRATWKLAEWLAALVIAPSAVALTLYFSTMVQSGQNLLDSFPTLATVIGISLPHCYAVSWFLCAPVYWFMARFTRRPIYFLFAGAVLGAMQTTEPLRSILPFQPGLLAWLLGFCVGAFIHWLIVVRTRRSWP